jgi:hypothetical protein
VSFRRSFKSLAPFSRCPPRCSSPVLHWFCYMSSGAGTGERTKVNLIKKLYAVFAVCKQCRGAETARMQRVLKNLLPKGYVCPTVCPEILFAPNNIRSGGGVMCVFSSLSACGGWCVCTSTIKATAGFIV